MGIETEFDLLIENGSWNKISLFPLPESFIEEHQHQLNWDYISEFQNLSPEFIDKYRSKLCFYRLKRNPHLKNLAL